MALKVDFNFDLKTIIIIVLILLLLIGGGFHFNSLKKHEQELQQKENLTKALSDTIRTYKNKEGEWVAEKLTIQAETKDLKDKNLVLTQNQSELIKRVDKVNRDNQIITAALIEMKVKLDGLVNDKPVNVTDSTVEFAADSDSIKYNILVRNVKPLEFKVPKLEFKTFSLPNKSFVEFHWKDDKKEGYPIAFTVTNTNPFFQVNNIDSYAIPELKKEEIKPTFWNKLGKFSKTVGGKIIIFSAGAAVGGLVVYQASQ